MHAPRTVLRVQPPEGPRRQRPWHRDAGPSFPPRTVLSAALRHTRAGIGPLTLAVLFGQGLTLLLAIPAIAAIFDLVLKVSGVARITDSNLLQVLSQPLAVVLLLVLAVLGLAAVGVQLASIVVLANRQQSGQPLNIRAVGRDIAGAVQATLNRQSPLLMVYVFLIMPLGGFGLLSAVTRDIGIPAFISGEMMKTPVSFMLYGALLVAIFYLNLRLVLVFPILIIERTSVWRAMMASVAATRRQSLRIAGLVGLIWITAAVGTAVLVEVVALVAGLAGGPDQANPATMASAIAYGAGVAGSAVILNLATVVIVQAVTVLCRSSVGHVDGRSTGPAVHRGHHHGMPRLRRPAGFVLAGVVISAVTVTSLPAGPSAASADLAADGTAVIAHRGFVGGGVENTISALEAAAKVEPDYVEIDAQQTKDGRFVLSHDVNLWLVSGENVNTYELTLQEAVGMTVTVGGFTDTLVSMKDYVKRAEELGVTLLIELKIHGHESPDVVDKFLATLDSIGSTEKHIYHSLNAGVIKTLQAKRPELTVGRTVAISVGDPTQLAGDFLVVEQSFFTEALAKYAREQNKQVFVWTVNDEDKIREYLRMPVDGIVTDHLDVAIRERARIEAEHGSAARLRDTLHEFTVF